MSAGQSLPLVRLLAGKGSAGLAIRGQPLPQAFDGIGFGKQILGDDQLGDLTIKPGDGFPRAFPRGPSCIAANLGLQTRLLERLRQQRDVAKLGEFLLGGPLPRQEWQGFSEPLEPAFRGMLFAQPELDFGEPRGGLSSGRVVLEPLAAVQRGVAFRFVGFLQL